MEKKFAEVTKANLDLQKTERDLRDQLLTSIPQEQFVEVKTRLETAEKSENELKIECDKLKEVSEVAKNQVELFEGRKESANQELTLMRQEVLDLQSTSDEKELIGRLHSQIIGSQMRENDYVQRVINLYTLS